MDFTKKVQKEDEEEPDYIGGIWKLTKGKDLVVRPADKGGIVILSKEQYNEGMTKLLEDESTYS